jgi:predicted chitinase
MLTAEQLQSIMPRLPAARNSELLPFLSDALSEFAIDAPARAAAFLAQLAHESGQFRFMEELWGPTVAQRRYEPVTSLSKTLGNTETGDGKRFKGRGPIQLTGRANYQRFGNLLGVDLMTDPTRAARPEVAFRIAGLFWSKKGLNELADNGTAEAFKEITRRINGGFNGLPEREAFYTVARRVLGVPEVPLSRGRSRDAEMPGAVDEPNFERGFEAIRAEARRRPVRGRGKAKKAAPEAKAAGRKARPAAAKRKRAAPKRKTAASRRKATTIPRKRKTAARSAARKSPRGAVKKR